MYTHALTKMALENRSVFTLVRGGLLNLSDVTTKQSIFESHFDYGAFLYCDDRR